MTFAKTGAVLFILWGVIHIVGGSLILTAVTGNPDAGYAFYDEAATGYSTLAGGVLGYLAFSFAWIGAVVAWVGLAYNWRNSTRGLALNLALVGLTDLGLVVFLVLPGFLSWTEASPGLVLFAGAAICSGIGCQTNLRALPD